MKEVCALNNVQWSNSRVGNDTSRVSCVIGKTRAFGKIIAWGFRLDTNAMVYKVRLDGSGKNIAISCDLCNVILPGDDAAVEAVAGSPTSASSAGTASPRRAKASRAALNTAAVAAPAISTPSASEPATFSESVRRLRSSGIVATNTVGGSSTLHKADEGKVGGCLRHAVCHSILISLQRGVGDSVAAAESTESVRRLRSSGIVAPNTVGGSSTLHKADEGKVGGCLRHAVCHFMLII